MFGGEGKQTVGAFMFCLWAQQVPRSCSWCDGESLEGLGQGLTCQNYIYVLKTQTVGGAAGSRRLS